jgi:hypothetical protein
LMSSLTIWLLVEKDKSAIGQYLKWFWPRATTFTQSTIRRPVLIKLDKTASLTLKNKRHIWALWKCSYTSTKIVSTRMDTTRTPLSTSLYSHFPRSIKEIPPS